MNNNIFLTNLSELNEIKINFNENDKENRNLNDKILIYERFG